MIAAAVFVAENDDTLLTGFSAVVIVAIIIFLLWRIGSRRK